MVRPTAAKGTQNEQEAPNFENSGVDPVHRLTNLEEMYGSDDSDGDDDNDADESPDTGSSENYLPSHDDQDYESQDDGHEFDFDDRSPIQASREALRRSRQTQEAVMSLSEQIERLTSMMQTGGAGAATPAGGNNDFAFSNEDRELINEAMQKDPATALEILQKQMIQNARQYADTTVESRIGRENAKREADRDLARMYPQMRNPTHPFRRAVQDHIREMKQDYRKRGIDPDLIPELGKYAAQEVAISNPHLLGNDDRKTNMREESRRRGADRLTNMNRSRAANKKDDLPDLTDDDLKRGSRLGLNMNDPHVRKSLQMRRRHYQQRRR